MKPDGADLVLVLGSGLLVVGTAMIYLPAALLVGGGLLLGWGYLLAAATPRKED